MPHRRVGATNTVRGYLGKFDRQSSMRSALNLSQSSLKLIDEFCQQIEPLNSAPPEAFAGCSSSEGAAQKLEG